MNKYCVVDHSESYVAFFKDKEAVNKEFAKWTRENDAEIKDILENVKIYDITTGRICLIGIDVTFNF